MPQAPKKSGRTVAATKQVTLLQRLHAFTAFLYACIAGSLFGQLRTVYARLQIAYENGAISAVLRSRRKRHDRLLFRMRLALASLIEKSAGYRLMARLRRTLLLCSLLDCHFFNIGPVLFYAMALAFTENYHKIEN